MSQPVKKKMLEQDKEFPEPHNAKVMPNHSHSSTKHKVLKEEKEYVELKKKNLMQNQLQSSPQHRVPDVRKAPLSKSQFSTKQQIEKLISMQPKISECQYVSSIGQSIFWGKRKRPEQDDFDDDCMVSNFNDIQKEERKSAKLARKEDEIERLRIEQEEREERLRRKAKKPKLNQIS